MSHSHDHAAYAPKNHKRPHLEVAQRDPCAYISLFRVGPHVERRVKDLADYALYLERLVMGLEHKLSLLTPTESGDDLV